MPYTITTKDGITINNIPDDVDPNSPELKARVAAIRSGGGEATAPAPQMVPSHIVAPEMVPSHVPGAALPESVPQAPAEPETTAAGLAGAVNRGLAPYAASLAAGPEGPAIVAGAKMLDPLAHGVNSLLEYFGVDPKHRQITPSEGMEMLMDKLGIYKPRTAAERVVQAGAEAAGGGLGTAKLGEALSKAEAPAVAGAGRMLAAQPVQQIAGSAGAGAASQAAAEAGAGPVGQIGAGLVGGVLGAKVATPRAIIPPGGIAPSIAEAEKAGIKVMTSDVMPPRTFASKWLQSMGEKIPVAGTGGPRQAQQAQRIEAIRGLMREFGADAAANVSDDVAKDLLSKRSSDITKYVNLKTGVIGKLAQAGEVPVENAVKAIDGQIEKLAALKTKEVVPVIDRLQDWKNSIQGQSLDNVEMLRAQIGESFKAPEMAASRSIAEKALNSIYGPLREDMGNFIKANGDRTDYTKWRVANARLAESMGELNKSVLKNVLDKGQETPEVVNRMLFSSKPSDVKSLMSGLTADGKSKAKVAILAKALDEAGGMENLSPDKFLTSIRKMASPIGVAFDGQDAQRVKGLARALKLTEQASKAALTTPTGIQAVPIVGAALLTDLLGSSGAALATGATVGGLARVYESAPVRNLLMKLPTLRAGSPEEAALFKRLTAAIQAQTNQRQEK